MKNLLFLLIAPLIILTFAQLFSISKVKAGDSIGQFTPATSFLPWSDWYPVDFNQPEGYRVINRWDSVSLPNAWMHGHSSLHVGNTVSTLPSLYNSHPVDYFFLWQCQSRLGETNDPNCYNQTLYREIISQGSAVDPIGKTTLEHWARGSPTNYEVYYDPDKIGYTNCDGQAIQNTTFDLTQPQLKKPWVLKLPATANTYYMSDPICALVFNGYYQDKKNIIDSRYGTVTPDFQTGNWISVTINHGISKDSYGFDIIDAENIYLTDNQKSSDRFSQMYCQGLDTTDTLHCINENGTRVGFTYTLSGKTYRTFAYEEYWMRKTASSGIWGNVIDTYGFGSFRYWSSPTRVDWDRVRNDGSQDSANTANNQQWNLEQCTLDQSYNIVNCYQPTSTPTPPPTPPPPTPTPTPTPTPIPKPGDLNGDGKVDIYDYNILVANFGHPYTIFDYNALVGNFGK